MSEQPESQEVEFTYLVEDLVETSVRLYRRTGNYVRSRRISIIVRTFGLACLVGWMAWKAYIEVGTTGTILVILIFGLPVIGVCLWRVAAAFDGSYRKRLRKLIEQPAYERLVGYRKLIISPESLRVQIIHEETIVQWAGIDSIEVTDKYAFFDRSGTEAVALPRHAFESEDAFNAFVEKARQYHAEAAHPAAA